MLPAIKGRLEGLPIHENPPHRVSGLEDCWWMELLQSSHRSPVPQRLNIANGSETSHRIGSEVDANGRAKLIAYRIMPLIRTIPHVPFTSVSRCACSSSHSSSGTRGHPQFRDEMLEAGRKGVQQPLSKLHQAMVVCHPSISSERRHFFFVMRQTKWRLQETCLWWL